MNISNVSHTEPKKQNNLLKTSLVAGSSWFVLDRGVGTLSDVYHNSKSTVKITKKELLRQGGKNVLYAGIFATILAPILGKLYTASKDGEKIDTNDISSLAGIITLTAAMFFRLFVASRPHPKWKGAFSKFIDMFL